MVHAVTSAGEWCWNGARKWMIVAYTFNFPVYHMVELLCGLDTIRSCVGYSDFTCDWELCACGEVCKGIGHVVVMELHYC